LLAHGQWFSPGTPASSTIKTGRHDIPPNEIILLFFFRPGGLMFFPNEIFQLLGFPIV
jgi:hypothetical protein